VVKILGCFVDSYARIKTGRRTFGGKNDLAGTKWQAVARTADNRRKKNGRDETKK